MDTTELVAELAANGIAANIGTENLFDGDEWIDVNGQAQIQLADCFYVYTLDGKCEAFLTSTALMAYVKRVTRA